MWIVQRFKTVRAQHEDLEKGVREETEEHHHRIFTLVSKIFPNFFINFEKNSRYIFIISLVNFQLINKNHCDLYTTEE